METQDVVCPLNRRQLMDEYFIENRTKLLDIAAFLDRLERAGNESTPADFRMEALRQAFGVLNSATESRVMQIQMIFSDPTTEPRQKLDQKGAKGAFDPRATEVS